MSAVLAKEGCATVGFEKSMWTVTIDSARIFLGAHIDDFVIACANQQVLDSFRARLLDAFEGTYEGALQHYLRCEVTRGMDKGTTYQSQTHYAEEMILRTHRGTISGMPLLALHPRSPTRASTKTTVTRILPRIFIDVIVALSAA